MAFGKKNTEPKKHVTDEMAPIPTSAGAPSVSVEKQWKMGRISVIYRRGIVRIYSDGLDYVSLLPEECAAVADALLQAAP